MRISRLWPSGSTSPAFILWAGVAAFSAYFSMYAFRKPFTAARFEEVAGWDAAFDFKSALVISQVLGYALSKFIGIKVVSEMGARNRAAAILGLISMSWIALIGFAITPAPWSLGMLFLNGLPLGMIWGLVFAYVEGRRSTEILGAILCASFIVSSGMVKSVGTWLMVDWNISEMWMPAATGAVFFPLLLISVLALSVLPPPDAKDEAQRMHRQPMNRSDRAAFLARHGFGVGLLVAAYVFFTIIRDIRDNFAAEIWAGLGYADVAVAFTLSELPIAVIALLALALVMFINDNRRALRVIIGICLFGAALIGIATVLFASGMLSPMAWMISSGAGVYLAYTPFNAMLFDRLIALTRQVGTVGFLIYLADASGYVGSVGLLLLKHFWAPNIPWLPLFMALAVLGSVFSVVLLAIAGRRFLSGKPETRQVAWEPTPAPQYPK